VKIAINNPAPAGGAHQFWGDYYFGLSLQRALAARGAEVVQCLWPHWDEAQDADVVLVLRGMRHWTPRPGPMSILWVISHPSAIGPQEIDRYDMVFVASDTHRRQLLSAGRPPLGLLRQCSDFAVSPEPRPDEAASRSGVLFVGNARGGLYRDVVYWAIEAGIAPEIIGREWTGTPAAPFVKREHIDNGDLPQLYRTAKIGLNDHWPDMRYYGYVNNRLFDCLFCGLPIISDHFPELEQIFGEGIVYARDAASFDEAYRTARASYPELLERTRETALRIHRDYTFDARAEQILTYVDHFPPKRWLRSVHSLADRLAVLGRRRLNKLSGKLAMVQQLAMSFTGKERKARRFLHVNPSEAGGRPFATYPGASYLTAGFGAGPWEASLDEDLHEVAHRRFDVVIVERETTPYSAARVSPADVLGLARLVLPGGLLLLPKPLGATLSDSPDLTVLRQDTTFDLLQAGAAEEGETATRRAGPTA